MKIEELYKACRDRSTCSDCPAKKGCDEFKNLNKNITEPWELGRLAEFDFSDMPIKKD